ncbi:hypothetical protein JX265_002001 [Neoarthrinium moseri]|uniref:Heterokaryon incompatibility domain-containing protein n=1 Tax=Neoarthrinium moseri TaxID=1658444 RepID=A0A9P9WWI4_9PEZI|nr:hypothetical protein JX265_002001 [Neoarthrinium moseri]
MAKLCEKCSTFVAEWYTARCAASRNKSATPQKVVSPHHQTLAVVHASAIDECSLCYQLIQGLGYKDPIRQRDAKSGILTVDIDSPNSPHSIWLSYEVPRDEIHRGGWNIDLSGRKDDRNDESYKRVAYSTLTIVPALKPVLDYISGNLSCTKDALFLCKKWLQACQSNHPTCQVASPGPLPTRLIYIGGSCLKLCITEHIPQQSQYATLSHCWGLRKFTTLTTGNLSSFLNEIPVDALTKTFKHAVQITRALGLEYIWIDSMCIMQDSAHDWKRESALMADVYGNAEINIAATSAKDGTVGCFFERSGLWRCQICPDPQTGELFDICPGLTGSREDPLGSRGWVVQERYLARRMLHFTDEQIFWECDGNAACEVFPDGYPTFEHSKVLGYQDFRRIRKPFDFHRWTEVVSEYSKSKLTKRSDLFVALAGIARKFETALKSEYVCGSERFTLHAFVFGANVYGE